MSIATEITRIQNAKTALKTSINSKGGTLTTQTLSSYAAAVDAIKTEDTFYKCTQITYQECTPFLKVTACSNADAIGTYVYDATVGYVKGDRWSGQFWHILLDASKWVLCHSYVEVCQLNQGQYPQAGTYTYQGTTVTITDIASQQPVSWSGKKATITGTGISFAQTATTGLTVGDSLQLYGIFTSGCTKRIYEDKLFYKCSANTDSNTKWDGYLLTITAQGISYASTAVSGLANDTGSALQINGIYTNGGTQRIYQSTLVAGNIRNGVQLLGITGTLDASGVDVSDTTTTDAQALSGTQFHIANGNLVQGTITSKPSQVYTPTTTNQVITAGQYLSGDQTIQGDSYLLPANIAQGVTIFGVTGTHHGGTDVSDTTATALTVLSGYQFHLADGTLSQGSILSKAAQQYTPSINSQIISSGQYLSGDQVILGDSNLVAGNIKKDITIFGVTGTAEVGGVDVSDTTTTAADVLAGTYFYTSAGVRTQGTITSKAAQTYTPSTVSQTIQANQYLSGIQTILGDANLIAGNIKKDITIFGVTGTLQSTDVSDTTAIAEDVVSGKYFYTSAGVRTQGTISTVTQPDPHVTIDTDTGLVTAAYTPVAGVCQDTTEKVETLQLTAQAAQTITPTTSNQIITSGKYLTGGQTILGDSNLVASNIASGVTIFNVTGTHQGGSSDTYYKCASLVPGSSSNQIIVSGAGITACNGTYTLADSSATGYNRVWYLNGDISETTGYKIYVWNGNNWGIYDISNDAIIYGGDDATDPWLCSEWAIMTYGQAPAPTVAQGTTPSTWTGNQLTIASAGITYASSVTSGLSIGSGTPVVGGIYTDGLTKRIYEDTLVASNIVSGVTILGVQGSHICSGGSSFVDGYFINTSGAITFQPLASGSTASSVSDVYITETGVAEPQYAGSGGTTNYYKCASVDSTTSTWTGYKATLQSTGIWTLAQTASSLSYTGSGYTPVQGRFYDQNADIQLRLKTGNVPSGVPSDVVCYYPLTSNFQQVTGNFDDGQITSGTADSFTSAGVTGSSLIFNVPVPTQWSVASQRRTLGFSYSIDTDYDTPFVIGHYPIIFSEPSAIQNYQYTLQVSAEQRIMLAIKYYGSFRYLGTRPSIGTRNYVLVVFGGTDSSKLYLNGTLNGTDSAGAVDISNLFAYFYARNGTIGHITMFNREVTAQQALSISNAINALITA